MELIAIKDWYSLEKGQEAVEESHKSVAKFKLGAVILDKRGRVVASGHNDTRKGSSVFGSKVFKTLHAEGAALRSASKRGIDVSGMTMLIFRKGNNLSMPCPSCQAMLKQAGIKKVYYSSK